MNHLHPHSWLLSGFFTTFAHLDEKPAWPYANFKLSSRPIRHPQSRRCLWMALHIGHLADVADSGVPPSTPTLETSNRYLNSTKPLSKPSRQVLRCRTVPQTIEALRTAVDRLAGAKMLRRWTRRGRKGGHTRTGSHWSLRHTPYSL